MSPAALKRALDPAYIGSPFAQPFQFFDGDASTPMDLTGRVVTLFLDRQNRQTEPDAHLEVSGVVQSEGRVLFAAADTSAWIKGDYSLEVRLDGKSVVVGRIAVAKGAGANGSDMVGAAQPPTAPGVVIAGSGVVQVVSVALSAATDPSAIILPPDLSAALGGAGTLADALLWLKALYEEGGSPSPILRDLIGNVVISSVAIGALSVTAAAQVLLSGLISGASSLTGALTVDVAGQIALSGSINSVSSASGSLTIGAASSIALVGSAISVSSLVGAMTIVQQIAMAGTAAGVSATAGSLSVTASGPAAMAFPAQGAAYDFDWTFLVDPVAPYRTVAPNTGSQPLSSNTNPLLYKQMTTQVSHYIEDIDGTLLLRDGNMGPRRSRKGLLSFNGQWNRTVAPRDLTNAAWTKTNATAALNQTGRDGSANAATLLTFTADGGTVSQTITNVSILRRLFFDVKRVFGADPLEFSFDNGATWYSITPTGPGWNGWQRAQSGLQTLADPVIVLRGKAGNSFAIDFVNLMEPREGLATVIPNLIRLTSATGVGRDRIHHTDTTAGGGPSGEQGINIVRSRYTHGLFVEFCYMNPATLVATLGGLSVSVKASPSEIQVFNGDDQVEQVSAPLNLDSGTFSVFNKIFYFRTPTELRLAVNGVLYRTTSVRNYTTATTHDFATNGALSALEGFVRRQPWFDGSRVPSDAEMIAWTL